MQVALDEAPVAAEKVPALHGVQADAPVVAEKVPCGHATKSIGVNVSPLKAYRAATSAEFRALW